MLNRFINDEGGMSAIELVILTGFGLAFVGVIMAIGVAVHFIVKVW